MLHGVAPGLLDHCLVGHASAEPGHRRLLSALGVAAPRLERHDDHSDEEACARLVAAIAGGEAVALVSDAGMPVIADPGFRLVRAARAAGLRVSVVPGPSAPLAALALSGLPSDRFLFAGFLPSRRGPRRAAISGLAAIEATLVLLEAPQRVAECLADLAELLGGGREAVLAREITKMFEEVRAAPCRACSCSVVAGSSKMASSLCCGAWPMPSNSQAVGVAHSTRPSRLKLSRGTGSFCTLSVCR